MAKTVIAAFNEFLSIKVNLDSDETKKARLSRDWLIKNLCNFPDRDTTFPTLSPGQNINFGSFARRTKIRELNDIDLIVTLHAKGSEYTEYSTDNIEITVPETEFNLMSLCHDNSNKLNSRKVINKFLSSLQNIHQYRNANIKRDHEAAVLNLSSYAWSFDIVPGFITKEELLSKKSYYLIPNGSNGHWKKTDPRLDRDRVTNVNQSHSGNILNLIRVMKYWNKRPTMPTMSSYLLENIILDYYESCSYTAGPFVHIEIPNLLEYISRKVYYAVYDPKSIQGDINSLSQIDRAKICTRAINDLAKANEAIYYEKKSDHKSAIESWKTIFGQNSLQYS